ncbi:MAG: 16S rRNA (adenine(1518)-N(6)/adenine(1519)-N(6))-dimethyltransferase RsmA [Acidimicrobiia bacterium]|nr:16S rRNA (adenine(1518)-N(6)/adenine(1519)-N(6))-dimethyltransferase RsmA [Acidimicrobiia bacterium]
MSGDPLGGATTADLLRRHDLRTTKALGQHFLVDPNTTRRIVEVAGVGPGDRVLEIGAGAGTLTRALAATGARVVAFEIDERLRPVLGEVLDGFDVDLRFADAATADLVGLVAGGSWTLVANLPYNVGTPLVLDLLRTAPAIERFVVMLQREAVERLAAPPGSRVYGLPSVVCAIHGEVEVAMRVPPTVFLPRPKVESAVAVVTRSPAPELADVAIDLAAQAFGQRRKMLRSSLRGVASSEDLAAAGIDPTARPEQVGAEGFLALAGVLR